MDTHTDLRAAVDERFELTARRLAGLVSIPSVSAFPDHAAEVRRSAETVRAMAIEAGFGDVQLLEVEGAPPAVFGQIEAPPGAPTVMLYAHHDVQPAGEGWSTRPFAPVERQGRLYGRGTADNKCGVVMHLAAVEAHGGRPPVGVKLFVEGEEEVGSAHLAAFLRTYGDLLDADIIVIADSGNWRSGTPTFTTSLRGLVDATVELRTLESPVHSGVYGGLFPDALTALCRLLGTLHHPDGSVAVADLKVFEGAGLPLTEAEARRLAGALDGVDILGTGSLTDKMWHLPAVSVLAIDAPPVDQAINALIPAARAKVSVRIPPGQDPDEAMEALVDHLERNAPWGAQVTVTPGERARAFALDSSGPAHEAFREAFELAWGTAAVKMGVGGSIPFVAAFSDAYPDASVIMLGVSDERSSWHGPDENVDLEELRRGCFGEAVALRLLGG